MSVGRFHSQRLITSSVKTITKTFRQEADWEYHPKAERLWNSVLPSAGLVLIEDWQTHGLNPGLESKNPNGNVYGVSVTHQYHCLVRSVSCCITIGITDGFGILEHGPGCILWSSFSQPDLHRESEHCCRLLPSRTFQSKAYLPLHGLFAAGHYVQRRLDD